MVVLFIFQRIDFFIMTDQCDLLCVLRIKSILDLRTFTFSDTKGPRSECKLCSLSSKLQLQSHKFNTSSKYVTSLQMILCTYMHATCVYIAVYSCITIGHVCVQYSRGKPELAQCIASMG